MQPAVVPAGADGTPSHKSPSLRWIRWSGWTPALGQTVSLLQIQGFCITVALPFAISLIFPAFLEIHSADRNRRAASHFFRLPESNALKDYSEREATPRCLLGIPGSREPLHRARLAILAIGVLARRLVCDRKRCQLALKLYFVRNLGRSPGFILRGSAEREIF